MASAPDTVTEMRSSNEKIHSAMPLITPKMGGVPLAPANAEMAIDDGAEFGGYGEMGQEFLGDKGRHRQNHHVVRVERHRHVGKFQRQHRMRAEHQGAQPFAQFDLRAFPAPGMPERDQ